MIAEANGGMWILSVALQKLLFICGVISLLPYPTVKASYLVKSGWDAFHKVVCKGRVKFCWALVQVAVSEEVIQKAS